MQVPPVPDQPADVLSYAVAALLDKVGRRIRTMCFVSDLPPIQWAALRYLARAEAPNRTITALSTFSNVSHGTVSRTVSALVRKGLVAVGAGQRDRRMRQLALTQEGWRALDNDPFRYLVMCVGALPRERRIALFGALELLDDQLHRHRDSPSIKKGEAAAP